MDFSLFLLAFTMLLKMSHAIKCYRCDAEVQYTKPVPTPICEHFDGSDRFIIDCPKSTGCVKKVTELTSLGEATKGVERDCADQTMDGDQEKVDGQWQYTNKIHEVYDVGCKEESSELGKVTKTTHCFCRGDLCNSAGTVTSGLWVAVAVLLWTLFK